MCITLDKRIIFGILLGLHLAFAAYGKEKGTAEEEAGQPPAGRVAWLIFTSMPEGLENPVTVLSGDEQTQVEPGETKIVSGKIQDKPTNLTIRYYFHHLAKGKWKILSSSSVAVYSTRREICIFSWDPRYKRIDYHGITFPVM